MTTQLDIYWDDNGKFQREYDSLDHLVPPSGMAETVRGEALRCMGNIYYDVYNNGGCNFDGKKDQWASLKLWLRDKEINLNLKAMENAFERSSYGDFYVVDDYNDDNPLLIELEALADAVIERVYQEETQDVAV